MRSQNLFEGLLEEKIFQESIQEYLNIPCKKSTKSQDMFQHIDFIMDNGWKVDVKTCKRTTAEKDMTKNFTWIELVNVNGNTGWIDGKATHIAFSMITDYFVIEREILRSFVLKRLIDLNRVGKVKPKTKDVELYTIYQRRGRKDKIVLIPFSDIFHLRHFIIPRKQ